MFFQNSILIEGNLCQKPELKESSSGVKYCRFSVCHNSSKKVGNDWENTPHFFNVVCYKKTAENVAKFEKGSPISVHGRLQYSKYENKNGEMATSISISADSVKKFDLNRKGKSNIQESELYNYDGINTQQVADFPTDYDPDNDIPF